LPAATQEKLYIAIMKMRHAVARVAFKDLCFIAIIIFNL
jgi:hypothetical protein